MRTREGMAIARSKGKLRGKQPKQSVKQQRELSEYSINDLADVFSISRATVYRVLARANQP
ncbi:helix-turn-helix domain-containing protein [Rhodococcus jostii]|uniref:helix-turn-helix domain-containing protein n=1 Tax=Rhodococcus jostii TaxID=132919 RepID=UPI00362E1393